MKKIKNFSNRAMDVLVAIAGKEFTTDDIKLYLPVNDKGDIIFTTKHNLEILGQRAVSLMYVNEAGLKGAQLRFSPVIRVSGSETNEDGSPVLAAESTKPTQEDISVIGKFGALIGKFNKPLQIRVTGARLVVSGVTVSTCPLLVEMVNQIITKLRMPITFTEILQLVEFGRSGENNNWDRFVAEDIDERFEFTVRESGNEEGVDSLFHEIRLIIRDKATKRLVLDTHEHDQSKYFGMNNWKDVMFIYHVWAELGEMWQRLDAKVTAEAIANQPVIEPLETEIID